MQPHGWCAFSQEDCVALVGVAAPLTVRLGMAGAIDDARKIKDAIEHDNVELVRRLLNHTNCELMERCRSA